MKGTARRTRASAIPISQITREVAAILTDLKLDDYTIRRRALHDNTIADPRRRGRINRFSATRSARWWMVHQAEAAGIGFQRKAKPAENWRSLLRFGDDVRVLLVKSTIAAQHADPGGSCRRPRDAHRRGNVDIYAPTRRPHGMQEMREESRIVVQDLDPEAYSVVKHRLDARPAQPQSDRLNRKQLSKKPS